MCYDAFVIIHMFPPDETIAIVSQSLDKRLDAWTLLQLNPAMEVGEV